MIDFFLNLAKAACLFLIYPPAKAGGNLQSITFSSLPNFELFRKAENR